MIFDHQDYRAYLRSVLSERHGKNQAYSLRAMARQIGCAPSTLSQILKGARGISPHRALAVALKLGLESDEAEYFHLMVQHSRAANLDARAYCTEKMSRLNPKRTVRDLSADAFKMIADWHHLAILEMSFLHGFRLNPENVATRLSIPVLEARTAFDRLERLELLEPSTDGTWKRAPGRNLIASQAPSQALRSYHRQTMTKAIDSLETQTPKEKFVGSENLALDSRLLPEANKLTEKYFHDMLRLAESSVKCDEVYHLGVQMFRLTVPARSTSKRRPS